MTLLPFMDGQWLKTQFASNPEKTKAGLAAAIGVEPPAVSKILNGSRQIKAQEYILMREYFGLPSDGHDGARRKVVSYSVNLTDGKDGHSLEDGATPPAEWTIPANISGPRAATPGGKNRIFQVRDSLMEPEFSKGEHVLVDTADRKPSPSGVFIVSDGFSNMLRYCEYLPKSSDAVRISARMEGFQPQVLKAGDFLLIGRVVAKLQMI
jgi:hypothetical protein